jgi:hypothetical protein
MSSDLSLKISQRVGTNRVTKVVNSVIRPTQTIFKSVRHIMEGVLILHQNIHELHRKKMNGIL